MTKKLPKTGAPPGTIVYSGKESSKPVKITLIVVFPRGSSFLAKKMGMIGLNPFRNFRPYRRKFFFFPLGCLPILSSPSRGRVAILHTRWTRRGFCRIRGFIPRLGSLRLNISPTLLSPWIPPTIPMSSRVSWKSSAVP